MATDARESRENAAGGREGSPDGGAGTPRDAALPPSGRADDLALFHLLRAVTVEYGLRQNEFAAAHGMHPTDVRALVCLLDAERAGTPATAGLVATGLGLNSAGTTAVLDRLESLGLIARTRDPQDRRRVLLTVEDRAKTLGRQWFGPLIARTTAPLRDFDENQLGAIRLFLESALGALAEDAPGPVSAPGRGRRGGSPRSNPR
ncbi:MarR family winged helix-turn-helix transcriptional regulator [Uniformispora flossi]|uniref:MarR family winged helix-turn-helix transcriptional regulator n=1 Tax=Uniformispora flossi TaxID=3390723 RepID=UPI003C2B535F